VKSSGAAVEAALLVDLVKYLSNIWGETTASGGEDSTGGCATPLPARRMLAGGSGAEDAGGALSAWWTTGAGSGAGTGTGKTNRLAHGRGAGEKRKGVGPTSGSQPGPGEAASATLRAAKRTKDKPCQSRNRQCFMGLISLFLKTAIQRGIGGLGREL
jgi:hypothetical protein